VVSDSRPKRIQRFGPEVWEQRDGHDWSLWDLWFCLIAVVDHDGDLAGLGDLLVDHIRTDRLNDRDANEAKLSHVTDLLARLSNAGLEPADLADPEVLADQRVARRAREKVTGRTSLEWRARTEAMVQTPRQRFRDRARFGRWPAFPSDPAGCFEKFRPTVDRKDFVTKGKTFAMVSRLEQRLADLDGPRRTLVDRLALYRAFHTAGLELADAADDSYGNVGQMRTEAWLTYLDIDWRATGIDPAAYWQDLCELLCWEPYGLDHEHETAWFGSATVDDVALIEGILLGLDSEYRGHVLDWEADEAIQALADLYLATTSRERYVMAARRLGSRWWRPIEAMAESMIASGNMNGAVSVFRAADQPGWHRDHLRARCRAMTGSDLG